MVMEFLEGGDLWTWLRERGPLPIEQAVEFVLQTCVAVADAHSVGIIHRDLKPANLFCIRRSDGQFVIKVLDFGISKLTDLSRASEPPGTPAAHMHEYPQNKVADIVVSSAKAIVTTMTKPLCPPVLAVVIGLFSMTMGGPAVADDDTVIHGVAEETWAGPPRELPWFPPAFELGFSIGFSLPLGVATGAGPQTFGGQVIQTSAQDLSAVFIGRVPFTFDIGYRTGHLQVSAYATYALSFPKDTALSTCSSSGAQCSGRGTEAGVRFVYHAAPRTHVDPWIAVGAGVESGTVTTHDALSPVDVTFVGFQAPVFEAGVDFKEKPEFAFGPFLGLSVGEYVNLSGSSGEATVSSAIDNKAWHGWFTIGMRGAYDFFVRSRRVVDTTDAPMPSEPIDRP